MMKDNNNKETKTVVVDCLSDDKVIKKFNGL